MSKHLAVNILGLLILGCARQSSPLPQEVLQTFTLEELIPLRPEFFPSKLSGQWISDSHFVYREPGVGMVNYDAEKQSPNILIPEQDLYNLSNHAISSFSKDLKYLLLTSNERKIYRYSRLAEYAVYDLDKKSLQTIGKGALQAVVWGNEQSLAYVQNNNVYYVADITRPSVVVPLTTEGVPGEVYFGVADWLYEEEVFNAAEALWFSPRGVYLAIASFNDTKVESAMYPIYGNPLDIKSQYPEMMEFKYPKAGRTNPTVGLTVFKLTGSNTEHFNIPAPVDLIGLDHILGRVSWASDQNLVVLWLNRRQNISVLVNCDLEQNKCNIIQQQTEPNGWIDINEPIFDSTGTKMLDIQNLYSDDQRFPHATVFDFESLGTEDLSPGNSTVLQILGWNQKLNTAYFLVAPGTLPWQRQVWSSKDGVLKCVSCKETCCHNVEPMFSPNAGYALLTCSSTNVPHKVFLYNAQNDTFKLLKDNLKLSQKMSRYKLPMTLFNTITLGDDVMANIKLLLPPEIKKDEKYPMVVRVYAGPGTTRVKDSFDLEYYNMYLSANRSFILASIDVRGSKVMGVESMFAINNALGTLEVTDTIDAIRKLMELYPFIDPTRIGVWGWSYGGFTTTMMLAKDSSKTIACGAAVAPVTSWLYYDSIYTERYLDTPQANVQGYHGSDLLAMAESLRGRRFLLVHGSGDDNVHYQHSMQLAKQLQRADIEFEQMSYTDENHSLRGVSRHFYHTLDRFWTQCFYP